MITTNDDEIAVRVDRLRNHGASVSEEQRHHGPKPYILPAFEMVGYNYRMTDIQGAIGVVQLGKLDKFINERQQWADYYAAGLKDIPWLSIPVVPEGYKHGWQSYVTYVDESMAPMKRNDIMELLQQKGIATRPGTHAVHMLNVYADMYDIKPQDFPGAFKADQYSMSIPMHNKMVKEDFDYIIEAIKAI